MPFRPAAAEKVCSQVTVKGQQIVQTAAFQRTSFWSATWRRRLIEMRFELENNRRRCFR